MHVSQWNESGQRLRNGILKKKARLDGGLLFVTTIYLIIEA